MPPDSLHFLLFFLTSILYRFLCVPNLILGGFGPPNPDFSIPKPSQNPFKMPSKSRSLNTCNFLRIFAGFLCFFNPRFLENECFASTGARFFRFSLKACFCNCHAFWLQKTCQKPFQNKVQTFQKSNLKTTCFLTSMFWGLGLDFGIHGPPNWS